MRSSTRIVESAESSVDFASASRLAGPSSVTSSASAAASSACDPPGWSRRAWASSRDVAAQDLSCCATISRYTTNPSSALPTRTSAFARSGSVFARGTAAASTIASAASSASNSERSRRRRAAAYHAYDASGPPAFPLASNAAAAFFGTPAVVQVRPAR
ncbi:MAG: hypothetical protein U0414_22895 [Polyangiaceae bacterium]